MSSTATRHDVTRIGDVDLHLFNEGRHRRLWDMLGAHLDEVDGTPGAWFAVWAPSAGRVAVVGDMNGWDGADECFAAARRARRRDTELAGLAHDLGTSRASSSTTPRSGTSTQSGRLASS